jgi:hypothetical protein
MDGSPRYTQAQLKEAIEESIRGGPAQLCRNLCSELLTAQELWWQLEQDGASEDQKRRVAARIDALIRRRESLDCQDDCLPT